MFRSIVLHGPTGTILWGGYAAAAELRAWRVVKTVKAPEWALFATLASFNSYRAGKTPLYFTAPRDKGRWCFPVVGELVITGNQLRAPLGPPEQ